MYQQPLLDNQLVYIGLRAVAAGPTVTLPLQYDRLTSAARAHLHPAISLYPTTLHTSERRCIHVYYGDVHVVVHVDVYVQVDVRHM